MQLAKDISTQKKIDWRIAVGLGLSLAWLLLLTMYLFQQVNWQEFLKLPLDEVGSFLGGAFSPLAFLWLVIGFFIQQGEIQENTLNIEIQAQHTNLDNFLKMADIVYKHVGVITGFLAASCQEDLEAASEQKWELEGKWSKASNGDDGIFAREILTYRYDHDHNEGNMAKIFYGTDIRRGHTEKYKTVFENLLDNSWLCDSSGGLRESLIEGSIWGVFYKVILETDEYLAKEQ